MDNLKILAVIFVFFALGIFYSCFSDEESSSVDSIVVSISDFGAVPDDGKDDTHAVKAALTELQKINRKVTLVFGGGTYDFFSDAAFIAHYPVTAVHKQWDFVTPFHLNGFENLTIDGGGSTFMMHGRMTPFVMNDCKNVEITRLSIRHERPSVFELKVLSKENYQVEFKAAGNDQFLIENNQIVWLDAENNRQIPNVFQVYDPVKDITRRRSNPFIDALSVTQTGESGISSTYEAGSEIYRNIEPGSYFQFRQGIRNQSGVVVYECQNITFSDLNVFSWNGLGFVCQFCRDLTFNNLRMEPDPESDRTNAGFADAIQILASKGMITIKNSRFVGLHDDHINIYGQMMKVINVDNQGMIEAVFTSNETEGFLNFRKGDSLVFHNPETLGATPGYRVTDSELLDDKTMRIWLEGEVPVEYMDYWIENLTWIPDKVVIRGNYFGRVPTRSILMYVARESIIENNTFHRIPMETILMKCPDQRWALQNHVGKLKVINNVFYECEDAIIRSNPQVEELADDAGLYGTLDVRDNLIIRVEGIPRFIDARGFTEVNTGSNRFETGQ